MIRFGAQAYPRLSFSNSDIKEDLFERTVQQQQRLVITGQFIHAAQSGFARFCKHLIRKLTQIFVDHARGT